MVCLVLSQARPSHYYNRLELNNRSQQKQFIGLLIAKDEYLYFNIIMWGLTHVFRWCVGMRMLI